MLLLLKLIFEIIKPLSLYCKLEWIIDYYFIKPNPCGYDPVVLQLIQCTCWTNSQTLN